MQCKNCSNFFKPSAHGRKPMFCSARCRVDYNRNKKRFAREAEKDSKKADSVRVEKQKVIVPVSKSVNAELDKNEFERMMDDSLEDELRFARSVLHKALISPDSPAGALAGITRELINVSRQLNDIVTAGKNSLTVDINEEESYDSESSSSFDSSII